MSAMIKRITKEIMTEARLSGIKRKEKAGKGFAWVWSVPGEYIDRVPAKDRRDELITLGGIWPSEAEIVEVLESHTIYPGLLS